MIQYTDANYWFGLLDRNMIAFFISGAIFGVLLGVGFALRKYWIPVLLILLPFVLVMTSLVMPNISNVTYRFFFFGVPALAVIAFSVWLARRE